jgi:hypothetical protein
MNLQIFWTDTQLHELIPCFSHLSCYTQNWGWNRGKRAQLGPKDRVNLRINLLYTKVVNSGSWKSINKTTSMEPSVNLNTSCIAPKTTDRLS